MHISHFNTSHNKHILDKEALISPAVVAFAHNAVTSTIVAHIWFAMRIREDIRDHIQVTHYLAWDCYISSQMALSKSTHTWDCIGCSGYSANVLCTLSVFCAFKYTERCRWESSVSIFDIGQWLPLLGFCRHRTASLGENKNRPKPNEAEQNTSS